MLIYIGLVMIMGNINAIVDSFLHPEIPYFDAEHLIVGSVTGTITLVLGGVIFFYINRLKKTNIERSMLLDKLSEARIKAENSDRLKSAFLVNMSHEIRTPMNGIMGFADLLKSPDLPGEKQQEYIDIIKRSGHRMLNIINDIIDISKIESGLMEVVLSDTSINEIIEYIYTFFKPEMDNKQIQFSIRKSLPDKKDIIKTDHEKIIAILTNLVKNAIKFTNTGSIEVGYKIVSLIHESMIQFYVKDTGIGIPKDKLNSVFERFIQVGTQNINTEQGAGLGLSISKSYVEMLGGSIWVENNFNHDQEVVGSTFFFTIPYSNEIRNKLTQVETQRTTPPVGQHFNLKILIVEDDEVSDLLITTALKKYHHQILHTQSGDEAIRICRNNPDIDLILMDIKMPLMDGYEATRRIREFNSQVVIIAQTAFGLEGDREKVLEAGCNDYISKPLLINNLIDIISSHLPIEQTKEDALPESKKQVRDSI
ncbi:MAG: response regulator [Bacteroidales bacterium]|nr:response regulator [Bacteroidales bacterium]